MTDLPSLRVAYRAPSKLKGYERNARTHSADQVAQIRASIDRFGFTNPVLVDEKLGIIAGHGRLAAALLEPVIEKIPTITIAGLSEAERRALVLADNKIALNAGWDDDLLRMEFADLRLSSVDLELTGFGLPELEALGVPGLTPINLEPDQQRGNGNLADRFGVPPFSVLSARDGWWQDRKRAWIAIGIQSEVGRGAVSFEANDRMAALMETGDSRVSPGGSPPPSTSYGKDGARGDGKRKTMRKPNAVPGGAPVPLDRGKGAR